MQRQEYVLYSFLSLVVVAGVNADEKPVSITYTCNGEGIDNITITNGNFSHVEVLKKTAGYCQPSPTNKDDTIECIKKFKAEQGTNALITEVTILYEDETNKGIVGGNNTKYYQLSCDEKATNKTAVMIPKNIWTTVPPTPKVLNADVKEIPSLKIVPDGEHIYVGQEVTLEMAVGSSHQLLPQLCTAYRTDSDKLPYTFWENCKSADEAITNAKSWTPTVQDDQGTLQIKIYAFRFIETDTLIIKCDTTVCPGKSDPACAMACSAKRRRREANNHQRKTNATVSITLKVSDRQIQDNGSQVVSPVWYIYTIGFGMMFWITSKTF